MTGKRGKCRHLNRTISQKGSLQEVPKEVPYSHFSLCTYLLEEAGSGHRDLLAIAHMPALT